MSTPHTGTRVRAPRGTGAVIDRTSTPSTLECRDVEPGARIRAARYLPLRDQAIVDRALAILGARLADRALAFSSPDAVKRYACLQIGALPHEVFGVFFLDSQHRLIAFEQMFRGTIGEVAVYTREVVCTALMHGAAAVILTHNHPSGAVEPSREDEVLTVNLRQALAMVAVRVLDHVIVGGNRALSMAERGVL